MSVRERISRIRKLDESNNEVMVYFQSGAYSKRKVYKNRRYGTYIVNKYKLYKIVPVEDSEWFEVTYLGRYDRNNQVVEEQEERDDEEVIEELVSEVTERVGYVEYIKNPKHSQEKLIRSCIENDIPVYLAGPAGSGKNFVLQKLADELELDFYFTNSVQQEYKITGFIDAGGIYHETEFYKAFKDGGLFFLDEIDASIPEVLILLNAAIANRYFEFPNGRIDAHEEFRIVAAGNTVGSGADELYNGRLVLDQATLDRFAIIEFDYERAIELSIAKGNAHLVDFVRELRRIAKQSGIRATFSYRCIMMVRDLEKIDGLLLKDILKIAVFKGMNSDNINSFSLWNDTTRYGLALRELQAS